MRRKALGFGIGFVLLLLALAFYPFETGELGPSVLDRAGDGTGIPLQARSARFRFSEGLSFEGVTASVSMALGGYDVELERVLFEHRPLALLRGRLELVGVELERPRVVIRLGEPRSEDRETRGRPSERRGPGARAAGREGQAGGRTVAERSDARVRLAPSEVRMNGGEFLVGERFSLRGVDLLLTRVGYDRRALTPLHALSAEGTIGMAQAALGSLRLDGVSARLSSENARLTLEELRFSSPRGEFRGSLACDFNVIPFRYRTSFVADPLAIEGLGPGILRLEASGFGTESRHLSGTGSLELAPGPLPEWSFLGEIHPGLPGSAHSGAHAELEVRDNVVRLQGLRFETASLTLDVDGEIDLDGRLGLNLTVHDGTHTEAFRLEGTRAAPRLSRPRRRD